MGDKRLIEFDILKGIGMILIMAGHTVLPYPIQSWIYSFHIPLFFIISGYFHRSVPLRLLFVKKRKHLLIPWIIFATLLLAEKFIFSLLKGHALFYQVVYNG